MAFYIFKRLLAMIPTLLGVAVLIFLLLRVVPGDVVEARFMTQGSQFLSQELMDIERKKLGLDQPMWKQFTTWMAGIVRGDFGLSMWTGAPISEEIKLRFALSLQLAIMASTVATLLAIPLGILAAIKQDTWVDYVVRVFSIAGLAMPSFWLGMLTIVSLLYFFNWLPPLTYTPIYVDPWQNLAQLFWPALAVGYRYSAVATRMTRSAMLEVLREDYIRTARAKGIGHWRTVTRHALIGGLIPVVAYLGPATAGLITGSIVIEKVFSIPGIGRYFVDAALNRDYTLVLGVVIFYGFLIIIANLIVDLCYALLDPKVRYD